MPILTINGHSYFYTDAGSGDPVLLLHGFTGSSAEWDQLTAKLLPRRRVITIDLPGHGRTDAPIDPQRTGMEAVARDLDQLCAELQTGPVHLLGYSMGGRLALYFAIEHPQWIRTLALESASPGLASEAERSARRASDEALAGRLEREGIEPFVNFWERLPLWVSQERLPADTRHELRLRRLKNRPQGLAHSLRGMGTGVQPSLWPRLGELQMPVLLLAGEEDPKFKGIATAMTPALARVELQFVPQAGHTIHLEQPDLFFKRLTTFWDRHD